MSSFERKFEKINCLLERLKSEASDDTLIVVEGEKDVESLRAIGVNSEIFAIKSCGKSLADIIDEIGCERTREIILLMDFDDHGRELTERLTRSLERMKVKLNLAFWRELSNLLNNDLKDIEGLATYIETLKRKIERRATQLEPMWRK